MIQMNPEEKPKEYELEYLGGVLTSMEGMFGTIASITNFLMQFTDNQEILGYTFIIFRRLYNFFPTYRPHLEEPIIIILIKILKNYSKAISKPEDQLHEIAIR